MRKNIAKIRKKFCAKDLAISWKPYVKVRVKIIFLFKDSENQICNSDQLNEVLIVQQFNMFRNKIKSWAILMIRCDYFFL